MGNYITSALLEERVTTTRLDSLCKVTGTAKETLLANVIARAESVIDAYASIRYKIPLPENDLTEEWALSIAEYELYKRASGADIPGKIKNSYDEALSMLNDMAQAKINIPSATEPAPASEVGSSLVVNSGSPLMDGENIKGF